MKMAPLKSLAAAALLAALGGCRAERAASDVLDLDLVDVAGIEDQIKKLQAQIDARNPYKQVVKVRDSNSAKLNKRKLPPKPVLDHRYNSIAAARVETLWAVRVIRNAVRPNDILAQYWPKQWDLGERKPTMMDLLWYWLQLMSNNPFGGRPFLLDPPIVNEGDLRNTKPEDLIWAMSSGHSFKNGLIGEDCVYGMDCYMNIRMSNDEDEFPLPGAGSRCEPVVLQRRYAEVRSSSLFKARGRSTLDSDRPEVAKTLRRNASTFNAHAGIAPLEHVPDEARNFFPRPLQHDGKNGNQREWQGGTDSLFYAAGAPFVAGASGSIQYEILTMEDTLMGSQPNGLIPCLGSETGDVLLREAIIGLRTAALVATGMHSMGECLAVAQEMGYFAELPKLIDAHNGGYYEDRLQAFEGYFDDIGLVGSGGVIAEFAKRTKESIDNRPSIKKHN